MVGYLTKNEAGMSHLLKAVNDQAGMISNMELLNQLSSVLDRNREVSIQEAIYRLLSLKMTKSTVVVKYISAMHPHFRDGLLKGDVENLEESESIFHLSPHQYYSNRPDECIKGIHYKLDEQEMDYWEDLTLADFLSLYDIVYVDKKSEKETSEHHIPLLNNCGYIKRRAQRAVLRYHLNFNNDEDFARGLLILFHPFRDELKEIHENNVKDLYEDNKLSIQAIRNIFEKHKVMSDIIFELDKETETEKDNDNEQVESENEFLDEETTSAEDIDKFEKWAKEQAKKTLSDNKELTHLVDMKELRALIINLNGQQRRIFDDYCERLLIDDGNSFYLYIAGAAGTGKSYLLRLMIDIVKHIKLKSGDELNKPPCIVMAPTANAAYIINGKTVEAALGIMPRRESAFNKVEQSKVSNLTFLYENVEVIFCDEISMVGSSKFTRINFQLQDIKGSREFMGGLSFVAVGDFHQLPPVLEHYAYENNNLDGRPKIAPSHWDENFKIVFLTEKMRSLTDPNFSELCDRVGNGSFNKMDEEFLYSRIQNTESENDNRNFRNGKVSIIVTTNKKRKEINESKLESLLPNEKTYTSEAVDRATNLENAPEVADYLPITKTGSLEKKLVLKNNAPVVITSNAVKKYKEDGIVNGARGYVDSLQMSQSDWSQTRC